MEVPLQRKAMRETSRGIGVSILVLMEVPLQLYLCHGEFLLVEFVSILVLMEVPLQPHVGEGQSRAWHQFQSLF